MTSPPLVLPDGALYTLTWSIPSQFGGLTKSLFQRSCQLATASGRDVTVITLDSIPDLDAERASLRERGLLVDGVSILNMWEELKQADDGIWATAPFDPSITEPALDDLASAVEFSRPDGSVLARQVRRAMDEPPEVWQHGDTLDRTEIWDREGIFRGGWRGMWPLWRWWLDTVLPRPAHVIVDSTYVADCLAAAPLPGIPTTFVVHNSHVAGSREAPYGRLEHRRAYAITRAHRFDAVVHLTYAQRHDVDLLFGTQDNAHVVPHAIEPPASESNSRRDAGRGIMMANLEARKRIPHAVRAMAIAAKSVPAVELAIYGRGPEREEIQAEIDEHGAPVRLEGYTSDPGGAFNDSSFMPLTSSREGFGLVLVESMAAGCLPIAYDIEYGPADIITDGVDGFRVPRGDEEALAARIAEVATASRRRLRRMRKAAGRRAAEFLPEAVIPRWGPVLEAAEHRARSRSGDQEPSLEKLGELERVALEHRFNDCHLEATVTGVTWDHRAVATVDVSCVIVDAGGRTGEPNVDVELIHRASGTRAAPPAVERLGPDPTDERPSTLLRLTIDPSTVTQPADHVVLLRARLGEIDVLDTPQPLPDAQKWLPLPVASPERTVLISSRRSGLQLVTTTPHAAGTVEVSIDQVVIEVASLDNGASIHDVELVGVDTSRSIGAERTADGRYRLDIATDGHWKVRARVDERWRDVAWRGPEPVPESAGAVTVELTPRGYVRLRRGQD
jgi:poly(glycerol-phosphate) alpha-glucosyltransferase